MKRFLSQAVLVAAVCASPTAQATSVLAPTFRELVTEADSICTARVTAVQSVWVVTGPVRAIFTDVTFDVDSTMKGDLARTRTLRFMGGELDGSTLTIPGVPRFSVGDRAVLFVTAETHSISPLVAVMHGRFPIQIAVDGLEYVTLHDGRAFASVEQIGPSSVRTSSTPIRTLRLRDFQREILLEVQRSGGAR